MPDAEMTALLYSTGKKCGREEENVKADEGKLIEEKTTAEAKEWTRRQRRRTFPRMRSASGHICPLENNSKVELVEYACARA
jgi:hypothetical protein